MEIDFSFTLTSVFFFWFLFFSLRIIEFGKYKKILRKRKTKDKNQRATKTIAQTETKHCWWKQKFPALENMRSKYLVLFLLFPFVLSVLASCWPCETEKLLVIPKRSMKLRRYAYKHENVSLIIIKLKPQLWHNKNIPLCWKFFCDTHTERNWNWYDWRPHT